MKYILIISSFLVSAYALPAYDKPIDSTDPENYKNIEIVLLESAVDQDGGYSFSFENDDGSKVSQEGQQKIVDDEAVDTFSGSVVRGSYSYNDVNGQPVSLTYTADENGFRPVGAHLPTPPPVPLEILRSLRFLATAKPFVDEQLYDYKPSKKVFRGRQYNKGNVPIRSRNNLRSSTIPETLANNESTELLSLKSVENDHDSKTETTSVKPSETTSQTTPESSSETKIETSSESAQETPDTTKKPAVQTTLEVLNESKKKISDALKESIEKTSKLTQTATQETANAAVAAIREETAKLTDTVKLQITKINEKISGASAEVDKKVSVPAQASRQLIEKYTAGEALVEVA